MVWEVCLTGEGCALFYSHHGAHYRMVAPLHMCNNPDPKQRFEWLPFCLWETGLKNAVVFQLDVAYCV